MLIRDWARVIRSALEQSTLGLYLILFCDVYDVSWFEIVELHCGKSSAWSVLVLQVRRSPFCWDRKWWHKISEAMPHVPMPKRLNIHIWFIFLSWQNLPLFFIAENDVHVNQQRVFCVPRSHMEHAVSAHKVIKTFTWVIAWVPILFFQGCHVCSEEC